MNKFEKNYKMAYSNLVFLYLFLITLYNNEKLIMRYKNRINKISDKRTAEFQPRIPASVKRCLKIMIQSLERIS